MVNKPILNKPEGISEEDFSKVLNEIRRFHKEHQSQIKELAVDSIIPEWWDAYLDGYTEAMINLSIANNVRINSVPK